MTPTATVVEPACPESPEPAMGTAASGSSLVAQRRAFETIPPATWDRLRLANPWATPFSDRAFHRAWWDAYRPNAEEETLAIVRADDPADIIGIVPLMRRHEVEPGDAAVHTNLRGPGHASITPVPDAAIFFGASYHADYATMLCAPPDLAGVAEAVASYVGSPAAGEWDVVDLRRMRCGDPTADVLAEAFAARELAQDWAVTVEREDVCPVVTLPADADIDAYLGSLDKKQRHEIRRKVRRAEAAGSVDLVDSADPLDDLEAFIDLHQKRWGPDGLFPATPGGDQSRVFFRGLFQSYGADGPLRMTFLTVNDRRIAAGIHFETPDGFLYYNAGVDPDARELSPGVVMTHRYVERAIGRGVRRLDFLRGDEPYKYDWGAVDEPIQRLLIRRRGH